MTRLRAPWWLFAAAACFAGCAIIGLNIWWRGPEPPFRYYRFDRQSMIIEEMRLGSSAERAGLQVGDRIVSFDGRPTRGTADWDLLTIGLEVNHPYTVEIERQDGSRAFLVMELLDGETLRDALRRQPRFEAGRTLVVLSGVCAAMSAAHRRLLVHRDLKPENIFLARGESGETVKVLDFGLAKFTSAVTDQVTGQTGPGAVVGTPRYMSPEQWLGEAAQPSWDTWALGVMAYEMIAGAHPFVAAGPSDMSRQVLAGRFTPLSAYLDSAPPSWQAFFDRALSRDASRRAHSADVFYTELAELLTSC